MSLFDKLRGLFSSGSSGQSDDDGEAFHVYVACERCEDVVAVRINRRYDLAQEFDPNSGVIRGYKVQKGVVDQRCYRPIQVTIAFDGTQREEWRDISGGRFLTREEYEAARATSEPPA